MLERSVDFFLWCVTIAASLVGAAGIMLAATYVLYLSYKALTWQANRITKRLVNLHGLKKTQAMYREAQAEIQRRKFVEGSGDE